MTEEPLAQVHDLLLAEETHLVAALKVDRTRTRGPLNRALHEVRRMRNAGYRYSSQAGQDRVVDTVLKGQRGGTFVDVGGYDGITGSNTFFLEVFRGWTGILVEPVPAQRAIAEQLRRCPCLPYAVAASDGAAAFVEVTEGFTQMSGLAEAYDPALLDQVRRDPRHKERVLQVQTRTLSRILTEAGLPHPDFISLDIEGGEVSTLAAFPFDRHNVRLWSIENNTGTGEIRAIMDRAGYALIDFCGPDELWHKRDL